VVDASHSLDEIRDSAAVAAAEHWKRKRPALLSNWERSSGAGRRRMEAWTEQSGSPTSQLNPGLSIQLPVSSKPLCNAIEWW
jgi:hypothetical protein